MINILQDGSSERRIHTNMCYILYVVVYQKLRTFDEYLNL